MFGETIKGNERNLITLPVTRVFQGRDVHENTICKDLQHELILSDGTKGNQ